MPEKRNSASRLASALKKALDLNHSSFLESSAVYVWFQVLGKPKPTRTLEDSTVIAEKYFLVMSRLPLLLLELQNIRAHLKKMGLSENTYEPHLKKIEEIFDPSVLDEDWDEYSKPKISNEVMLTLNFCRDIMPDDEDEVSIADLQTLSKDIDELEQSLKTSQLPAHLAAIIKRYIASMQQALDEYPISGARSLKSANNKIVGELVEAQADIKEHQDKPTLRKMGALFKKVNDTAEAVIKVEKIAQVGHKAAYFLLQIFN